MFLDSKTYIGLLVMEHGVDGITFSAGLVSNLGLKTSVDPKVVALIW